MIGILDIDMGNLRSVYNAVYQEGFDPVYVASPEELDEVERLIIPGVGQFSTAMEHMHQRNLVKPIQNFAENGNPVLGICLGMQLLADWGDEGGGAEGLGLIPGRISRFPRDMNLSVPHVGWNTVTPVQSHLLFDDVKPGRDFYFVHSYVFQPDEETSTLTTTPYGDEFTSAVIRGNVAGFQFHPEKSQVNGLKLLSNFCDWNV